MANGEKYRIKNIAEMTDYTTENPDILREDLTVEEIDLDAIKKANSDMVKAFEEDRQAINQICLLYFKTIQGNQRYEKSEVASKERAKVEKIQEELKTLYDGVKNIDENFDSTDRITAYNNNLKKMKLYAKRKLLELDAKKVNQAAENGTSNYVVNETYFSQQSKPHDHADGGTYVYYKIISRPTNKTLENGKTILEGNYEGTKKIFRYFPDSSIRPISWKSVTESDVKELESRFHANHIPFPY